MLGAWDSVWSAEDWTRAFRLVVLNGIIPILLALGIGVSARWRHRRPSLARRARAPSWPLDPIELVVRRENEMIFRTASGILADDPRVPAPPPRGWKNAADLACALALVVLHALGVRSELYARHHFFWFLAWVAGAGIAALALEARESFRPQKVWLSGVYVLVMLSNVRSTLLLQHLDTLRLNCVQLAVGATMLLLALFVPTAARLPRRLVRLRLAHKPLADAGTPREIPPPPDFYASPFARATFGFITRFVWKHYWTPTTIASVPEILPPFRAACIVGALRDHDESVYTHGPQSLASRLAYTIGPTVLRQWTLQLCRVAFRMGPILALSALLAFAEARDAAERSGTPPPPLHMGLLYAGLIYASQMGDFLCDVNSLQLGRVAATQARSLLITEIVSKALRRHLYGAPRTPDAEAPAEAPAEADDGRVLNLVSVDTMKIDALISLSHQPLIEYPLTILLCVLLLFRELGAAAGAGLLIMLIATPLQARLSRRMLAVQARMLRATDARLRLANEVLACIKTVKFFAWEAPFVHRMNDARAAELRMLALDNVISVLSSLLFVGMPMLVTLATFGVYTLALGEPLTAQKAFTALSIFNALRVPLADLPELVVVALNSWVSLRRIDDFLGAPDTDKYAQLLHADTSPGHLGFRDASFTYERPTDAPADAPADAAAGTPADATREASADAPTDAPADAPAPGEADAPRVPPPTRFALSHLNCRFPVGALSLVTGPVGAGKSSLLLALLGELRCTGGAVTRPSAAASACAPYESTAYCAQSAWIVNASVRENILLGRAYEERRYRAVLDACALGPDLDLLEYHDATEVGEKGTSLSGGQKARVALARAFYSRAPTVLIDDALAAVDAHTARHLVEHCLRGPLAADRTVILVTHAVPLVEAHASYAVVLDAGRVAAHGTPAQLRADGHLRDMPEAPRARTDLYEQMPDDGEARERSAARENAKDARPPAHRPPAAEAPAAEAPADAHWAATQRRRERKDTTAHAERIHRATAGGALYGAYLRAVAASPWAAAALWGVMLALYVGVRSADVGSNAWLRNWANAYTARDVPDAPRDALYYLVRYVALVVLFVLLSGARDVMQFTLALRASRRLYERLVTSLLRAPPRFFDVTPIGRIMNRLSRDVQTVDTEIRPSLRMLTEALVTLVAILAVICWATPHFLYLVGVVLVVYFVIGALYLGSSRDLKRIESVQRSPLYTLLGETLAGTATIRAFGDTERVVRECMRLLDGSARAFLCLWFENRWVSVRVDAVGALVTLVTAVLLLVTHADAALLGFTLSYAVLIVNTILRIVRRYTMTEITLNSVERLEEYIALPPENPGGRAPPAHWPTDAGRIEVRDLCVRYAPELPRALTDVSLSIAPGEKVGIVGRTGSGKSTLTLAFFRFLEAEAGSITIDGIDIASLTLASLRQRLTILPQDAQLFQGTVRMNLDPFGMHDDGDMWFALQRCQLAHAPGHGTPRTPAAVHSLEDPVEQGGANFSAGQRQLLSLARGLLKMRDSRVLILDESTANLDAEADALIQRTIREQMAPGATLLTVAHRLKTIIDYDKVLVLDQGRVREFDTPANLLADPHSEFHALCERSGELDALTAAAPRRAGDARP
ncbi:hypothetical protein MOBT1_001577 [Malassezia obtusa]|uniref:ATP-dependent bile acid permease n=1 Tax=Malassezia obtusa TaxID=76774 RepID=A0AAF0E0S0_9BASI|nr:hypothetical protein MOBT1_001577 [Malassezia obtusa]